MEIVLRRYGNSTVAVFPPTVLKDLGLSAGQSMIMNTTEDGKIVLARKRKYILADLLAQCDPRCLHLQTWACGMPRSRPVKRCGDASFRPWDVGDGAVGPSCGQGPKGTRTGLGFD